MEMEDRDKPNRPAGTFKQHLIVCAPCTAGDHCPEGKTLFDGNVGVPTYLKRGEA